MYVQQTSTLNQTNATIVPLAQQQQSQNSSVITDITNLVLAVDGNLTFNDNFAGVFVSGTIGTTPTAISHTLGSIPVGFITTLINKPTVLYMGGSSWTSSTIYLTSGTASTNATVWLIAGG